MCSLISSDTPRAPTHAPSFTLRVSELHLLLCCTCSVIPGAYDWAMPNLACPLDHMLNPAEIKPNPKRHVREHSFLHNPRLPPSVAGSRNSTRVALDGGLTEMARLRAMAASRVLHITNVADIADGLWRQQPRKRSKEAALRLFTDDEWRGFRSTFANLQGGWCCAPHGLKPNAAGFHLMHAPPAARARRRR